MLVAWVIVHIDSKPGEPNYFTGARHPAMRWSTNNSEALRMSRQKDAERVMSFAGFYAPNPVHKIEEHMWDDLKEPKTPNGRTIDDAVSECQQILRDTMDGMVDNTDEWSTRVDWLLIRITKASEALADRPGYKP